MIYSLKEKLILIRKIIRNDYDYLDRQIRHYDVEFRIFINEGVLK